MFLAGLMSVMLVAGGVTGARYLSADRAVPLTKGTGPGGPSGDSVCGEVVSRTEAKSAAPTPGTQAVYSSGGVLWLYDASTDSTTRLTSHPDSSRLQPRYRGPRTVSFIQRHEKVDEVPPSGQTSLYELDLEDRRLTEILRVPTDLFLGYGWSPDGEQLAYHFLTSHSVQTVALCLYDSVRGTMKELRSHPAEFGRGPSQSDEAMVAWSPQGSALVVTETHALQDPSLVLIDRDGGDVVPPFEGTFARWLPDGRTVLFREPNEVLKPGGPGKIPSSVRWFTLDITSGKIRSVGIPAGTFRPAISPDGRLVAYDDGDQDEPSTFLYDVASGTSRMLIRGYGAPIWLGASQIAVTAGGPCPPGTECFDRWTPLDRTVAIDVGTGKSRELRLPTTIAEQCFCATIDVTLGSKG
jgi:hypothetical protein